MDKDKTFEFTIEGYRLLYLGDNGQDDDNITMILCDDEPEDISDDELGRLIDTLTEARDHFFPAK